MRKLLFLVIFAALGWSGYWWVGSTGHEKAVTAWLEDRRAAGWVAEYSSLKVQGFPNRFDTVVVDFHLADPVEGWSWDAPQFQTLSLSYQPNHIIAVWPNTQSFATPGERITIESKDMRASVKFEANTSLALQALTMTLRDVALTSTDGWKSQMSSAVFATRQTQDVPFAHDIAFDATEMTPPKLMKLVMDPAGLLPETFDKLHIDTTIGFDAAWDRHAIEGEKPNLISLGFNDVYAIWGELELAVKGDVDIDRFGTPEGKLEVRAKNWRKMLDLAVNAELLTADLRATLERGLEVLAGLSGGAETINIPLSFKDGTTYLGPFPVGSAPRIKL